jgi:hypothetical protein
MIPVVCIAHLAHCDIAVVRHAIHFPGAKKMWMTQTLFPSLRVSCVTAGVILHPHVPRTKKREFILMEALVKFAAKRPTWPRTVIYASEVCTSFATHGVRTDHCIHVDNVDTLAVMGTRDQPGADEDDFHMFRRRRQEVEKETVDQEKKTRQLQVKHGTVLGITKPSRVTLKPVKRVVFF